MPYLICNVTSDPKHEMMSITFPVNQLDKGECSVARTIRVELDGGDIFIDVNFKGQLLGIEILNTKDLCSETMRQSVKGV